MSKKTKKESVDEIVSMLVLKKITMEYNSFDSFKAGLIDNKGNVLDLNNIDKISSLEQLAIAIKKMSSGKINFLKQIAITLTSARDTDLYSKIVRTNPANPANVTVALEKLSRFIS